MHPVLSAGFRPFFLAAASWAALALAAWLALLDGQFDLPSRFDPMSWHIHEMVFGVVMAAIAGFLLTAIPNWTVRAPIAGTPLALLVVLWAAGRIACAVSAWLPGWLAAAIDLAFGVALAAVAARELLAARNRRNYPLLLPLVLLVVANLLMHLQALDVPVPIGLGWRIALACVLILISVVGGRIIPAFTRNWLAARGAAKLPAPAGLADRAAMGTLHGGLIAWAFLPDARPIGILLIAAAALNLQVLARWRGLAARDEPLLLVLHLGYLWLVVGTLLLGLSMLGDQVPASGAIHALTAGAIGTMLLAVMTRVSLGHTGRPLQADRATVTIYGLVLAAAVLRVAAAWAVDLQPDLLEVSAVAWVAAFALFAAQYGPMLTAPRL